MKPIRALTLLTIFMVLTGIAALAQQVPVFRSRVEIVQLDVSVLDKNRHPVRGLTQDDFTILENGKPQKIVGFSAFDIDDAPPVTAGWMRDVPPDVTTNELKPESRLFVMVIDDGLIPQDPAMIRDAKRVVTSVIDYLSPADLMAIVFTGDNRKTQDFTNDRTKLLAVLDKFNPGLAGYRFGLETAGLDVDFWFYESAVRTLGLVADYLTVVPNRRKALFWISPGVPLDLTDCRPVPSIEADPVNGGIKPPPSTPTICPPPRPIGLEGIRIWSNLLHRLDDIFRNAQRANVTMYPIDPTGLGGMRNFLTARLGPLNDIVAAYKSTMQQDFLATAAANTGGRTVMNTNDFEPGIRDIFEENRSYYLLAFEAPNLEADGKLHKLDVKVNRPDVEVRTRSGFYAPKPEQPADKNRPALSPEVKALAEAIGGLLPDTGLPMQVTVAPFAVPGQRLSTVTVVLGVRQPIPAAARNGRVTETTELQTSAFTPEGDPRGTQRHTARVTLRAGSDGEAAYEVLGRIDLPPGRYRLRLAAHNATSTKTGSVFADVIVPDYANLPVSAAPIVLTRTPARASAPTDLFAGVLPFVPTADRTFATTDKVTALLRLYQNGKKAVLPAQATITLRDDHDAALVSETKTIGVNDFVMGVTPPEALAPFQPTSRARIVQPVDTSAPRDQFVNVSLRSADLPYALPLTSLRAGAYLLSFEVEVGDTTLKRDVRFTITMKQ